MVGDWKVSASTSCPHSSILSVTMLLQAVYSFLSTRELTIFKTKATDSLLKHYENCCIAHAIRKWDYNNRQGKGHYELRFFTLCIIIIPAPAALLESPNRRHSLTDPHLAFTSFYNSIPLLWNTYCHLYCVIVCAIEKAHTCKHFVCFSC